MARPEIIKTELGQRLRNIRSKLGDPDREEFAKRLGISKGALANYERGDRVPDSEVLARYLKELGVDLNWLAAGSGNMFAEATTGADFGVVIHAAYDPSLLATLHDRVTIVYMQAKQPVPPRRITEEAAVLYNELSKLVSDLSDEEEVAATLPRLEWGLKKRLEAAASELGSGKLSAS